MGIGWGITITGVPRRIPFIIFCHLKMNLFKNLFSCPDTFKFRTRLLAGTASGMASDCVRGMGRISGGGGHFLQEGELE